MCLKIDFKAIFKVKCQGLINVISEMFDLKENTCLLIGHLESLDSIIL